MDISSFPKRGVLGHVSKELLDLLHSISSEISLAKDQILCHQGEHGDALYTIERGTLELSILSREGRKLSLDVLTEGALLGEIALLDPGPRTATITALCPSIVRSVRNADVFLAMRERPELSMDMLQLAGRKMRWMSAQFNEQVFLPMPARLARKIIYLLGSDLNPDKSLSFSQAELAEFVGATRETVSKTLSSWRRQGVIDGSRGGLKVLDHAALQRLAELQFF